MEFKNVYCNSTEKNYELLSASIKKGKRKKLIVDLDDYLYLMVDENGEIGSTSISFNLPRLSHYKRIAEFEGEWQYYNDFIDSVKAELNTELLKEQKVEDYQVENMYYLYQNLKALLSESKNYEEIGALTPVMAKSIAKELKDIEFSLQDNWNFERNEEKHSYWNRLAGCTCPKMDNKERWGTPYKVISQDCPYHGEKDRKWVIPEKVIIYSWSCPKCSVRWSVSNEDTEESGKIYSEIIAGGSSIECDCGENIFIKEKR